MTNSFIADFLFSVIFSLFLIFLIRIKRKTFSENIESYKYILTGISTLLLVSIMRLCNHQNLFATMPFISDNFYHGLVDIIGVIAGISLLVAGITIWLPSRKRTEQNLIASLERFERLTQLQKTIIDTDNINVLFRAVPEKICEIFGFESAAVFRFHRKTRRLVCTNRFKSDNYLSNKLNHIETFNRFDIEHIEEFRKKVSADYFLPIKLKNKTGAIIIFWQTPESDLNPECYSMLDYTSRLLAQKMEINHTEQISIYHRYTEKYLHWMNNICGRPHNFQSALKKLHTLFKHALNVEYLSLAVGGKSDDDFKYYTIGLDNRVFLENGVRPPHKSGLVEIAISTGKSQLINDIDVWDNFQNDVLVNSCNLKSLLVIPIKYKGKTIAVLQLGHSKENSFSRQMMIRARILSNGLLPIVNAERESLASFDKDRFIAALSEFDKFIDSTLDLQKIYNKAAEIISENVHTTMTRLFEYDNKKKTLISRAIATIRPLDNLNSSDIPVNEENLAYHFNTIETKRPLNIKRIGMDNPVSESELNATLFDGASSSFIIPITVNSITYGVITMGEMRESARYEYDASAIAFVKGIAARIASAIKLYGLTRGLLKSQNKNDIDFGLQLDTDILFKMKSPLTSIRGSLDLLKSKKVGADPFARRILDAIDDSTNELATIVNKD